MTEKKYLVVAVLATFCLTAALFMIVPTKSQSGSYDARTDVNGDGTIDMADISIGIDGFMTNGDPTLNVSVTNWPSPKSQYELLKVGSVNWTSGMTSYMFNDIYVGGYSRTELLIEATNASSWVEMWQVGFGNATFKWYKEPGEGSLASVQETVSGTLTVIYDFGLIRATGTPFMVETKAPYCSIYMKKLWDDGPGWWETMDFYLYLRNE